MDLPSVPYPGIGMLAGNGYTARKKQATECFLIRSRTSAGSAMGNGYGKAHKDSEYHHPVHQPDPDRGLRGYHAYPTMTPSSQRRKVSADPSRCLNAFKEGCHNYPQVRIRLGQLKNLLFPTVVHN